MSLRVPCLCFLLHVIAFVFASCWFFPLFGLPRLFPLSRYRQHSSYRRFFGSSRLQIASGLV